MRDGSMIFNRSDPCGGRILSLLSGGGLLGYGFTPSDPLYLLGLSVWSESHLRRWKGMQCVESYCYQPSP